MAVGLTLLVDADITTYVHARAGQRAYDFDGDGDPALGLDDIEQVKAAAEQELLELQRKFETDQIILCYTDTDGNFRKKVLPTYKAGRPPKPVHYHPLREHLSSIYRTYLKPHLEGDDVMGILATHPTIVPGEKIIVSLDKDMGTVPGKWYRPGKGDVRTVTLEQADYFFYTQVLTGDPTDNYKGCPRVGPKGAEAVLSLPGMTPWEAVVSAYERRGLTEADALVQARCARILRHTDYDFKAKAPILWNPPKRD